MFNGNLDGERGRFDLIDILAETRGGSLHNPSPTQSRKEWCAVSDSHNFGSTTDCEDEVDFYRSNFVTRRVEGICSGDRIDFHIADDFWQQFLNTFDQIQSKTRHLSTLREIKSSTDQTVKLLTDGHGFGPHPSASGSSKRQRLGEDEERGGDVETEKLQKK
ncbi:hypothetical protein F2Q68_00011018 [Brassica cretica]|uniref:Uncharacterized protein n=1 Tax=Brassica cretica TaxID=69181 RepID=A0A8S9L6E5_BRACR|nr:hypothetical protein F2Q68_00011018 [Brassica cretica]